MSVDLSVNYFSRTFFGSLQFSAITARLLLCAAIAAAASVTVFGNPEITTSDDDKTVFIGDAPEQEVYVFGKSVLVNKRAKGVLAIGGDVTIEGRVEGDVATIGGNVIQKKDAYIGGDVIVFGGAYSPEIQTPLREPGRETVMFGVFEDELREMAQSPSRILSPSFSLSFLAQRLVLALIWFVISMVVTTITPGAISRASAKLHLSPLKIGAIGSAAFVLITIIVVGGALMLPDYLGVSVGALGLLLMLFGYVFGRVTLQVSIGKLIQRRFFPENNRSETLAILTGVLIWTIILSLPYIWPLALFVIFALGIGLIFTARADSSWSKAA